ncbi:MAG TPA: TatD family hydrolase [Chitinophagaceae bacterium]|nr:TatD family hydrolase [Chitinophagaceae bacterium]
MKLIDTHCHLYLSDFEADIDSILERAETEGVARMYLPAIDSGELDRLLHLEKAFPGRCIAMMGLHPCSVKENYQEELRLVNQQLAARKFAAIGETGLDFYWDLSFTNQQYDAFRRQINWARELDIPVVIHSRNSLDECIGVIKEHQHGDLKGIFHCFSGSLEQANAIRDLGFFMGIGGVLTYKNSGLAPVVKDIPLESLVLETDAPYLTPVPFRGKRNESSYLKYIVQKLAEVKEMGVEEVASVTTANAENIFNFKG